MRTAIVIPVYNEARWVAQSVRRVMAVHTQQAAADIHLVDDGSTDGTLDILTDLAKQLGITLHCHPRNMGKGAALRTGIAAALASGAPIILIHDADLEYDPADHANVLAPILDGRADAVIGSRFIGQTHRVLYYWHSVANSVITTLCNMVTNINLTDVECCTKAFKREVLEAIDLKENRFGIEIELVAKVSKVRLHDESGMFTPHPPRAPHTPHAPHPPQAQVPPRRARIYEVAVSYAGRTYSEGKKINWKDGLAAVWCIFKYAL